MSTPRSFATLLEAFFTDRLMNQRMVSPQTIAAYRDTFRLLLRYTHKRRKTIPSDLRLEDFDASLICDFLDHLEKERKSCPRTRNQRLAAIRSFFRYVGLEEPAFAERIQRTLAIPTKRWEKKMVDFLTRPEADALLAAPDTRSRAGRRDHALLSLAIHTGLRVSELTGLRCQDIALGTGSHVRCHGKGRKERAVPLSKTLSRTLRVWLRERNGQDCEPLFPNAQGQKLSRDGVDYILRKHVRTAAESCTTLRQKHISPHTLRHTTAVSLLQAGFDLSLIALWLGHEDLDSTQIYIESDIEHKRKILEKTPPFNGQFVRFRPDDSLMAFLDGL